MAGARSSSDENISASQMVRPSGPTHSTTKCSLLWRLNDMCKNDCAEVPWLRAPQACTVRSVLVSSGHSEVEVTGIVSCRTGSAAGRLTSDADVDGYQSSAIRRTSSDLMSTNGASTSVLQGNALSNWIELARTLQNPHGLPAIHCQWAFSAPSSSSDARCGTWRWNEAGATKQRPARMSCQAPVASSGRNDVSM